MLLCCMYSSIYATGSFLVPITDSKHALKNSDELNMSTIDVFSQDTFSTLRDKSNNRFMSVARIYCSRGNKDRNFYDYEKESLFSWFFERVKNGDPLLEVQSHQEIVCIDVYTIYADTPHATCSKRYEFPEDSARFAASLFYCKKASLLDIAFSSWVEISPELMPLYFKGEKLITTFIDAVWEFTDAYMQREINDRT